MAGFPTATQISTPTATQSYSPPSADLHPRMTTTELRIAVLLAAIVVTYLLVKLYLHVLRSRVIPAIEPEAGAGDEGVEPAEDTVAEPDADDPETGDDDRAGG